MIGRRRRSMVVGVGALLAVAAATPGRLYASHTATVSSLAACPAWGAESHGSPHGLLNEIKHRRPEGAAPVGLDFADLAALQRQANARVSTGKDSALTAHERAKLRELDVRDGRISEGDLVAVVAYVVGKPEANVGESVNCFLRGPANNDFHFTLAAQPHASPYEGFVAEMIPQNRPKGWTLARLRALSRDGREVEVVGQLMLDNIHKPNPVARKNDDPPRAVVWEIHPVTKLLVCERADNRCDPSKDDDWQPLESARDR